MTWIYRILSAMRTIVLCAAVFAFVWTLLAALMVEDRDTYIDRRHDWRSGVAARHAP